MRPTKGMRLTTVVGYSPTYEVLPTRAAGTHCTRCRKVSNVDPMSMCTFDVPPNRAAGPQCTQCPTVFIVDQLAGAAAGEH